MFQSQSQSAKATSDDAEKAALAPAGSAGELPAGPAAFDESLRRDGTYRALINAGLTQSSTNSARRNSSAARNLQRLVHEQGIAYNVYGDPRGMERPWQLDPIPFHIGPDEWRTLEEGLVQRATLQKLADC